MSPDKPYHHSQCIAIFHPRAFSNVISPNTPSQPGMHLIVHQPITCFPKEAQPQMTSTSSPLSNSDSSPWSITILSTLSSGILTLSTSNSEADFLCSTHSIQSTRQLHPRLPITYNKTALMKLHDRPQVQMLNSISKPFPFHDSDQESSTTYDSNEKEEESPTDVETNYEKLKSPTPNASSTVPKEKSPTTPDFNDMKWSPTTQRLKIKQ